MSEIPEPSTTRTSVETAPSSPGGAPAPSTPPNRLYQFAAWVGIVAGIVFIVAVIFFAGFGLGMHTHMHHVGHHKHHAMVHRGHAPKGHRGGPGFVIPGRPGGPGHAGHGNGPGQPPQSIAPSSSPATP